MSEMTARKKKGLGRGLEVLLGSTPDFSAESPVSTLPIFRLKAGKYQPRTRMDEGALNELAQSIREQGVMQPILVRPTDDGDGQKVYEIIAGERRWRAAKLAGLKEVPVIIRKLSNQQIVEISLIENIQREDLNPIEEAQAYKRLLTEFHLKQDEVAERVSKSRAAVTNSIRLLKLNEEVQRMVVDEMISTGHARALLAVENPEEQYNLAQRIFDEKLSVRDVEKLVKNLHKPAKPKKVDDKTMQVIYQDIEEKLKQKLGRKVTVTSKGEGSGKIEIEFYNHEDLDRLLDVLNK